MSVSINPTYFCNFRCDFCYLTHEQLANQKKIDPDRLDELLSDIPNISHIDLYGGEIGAIKRSYYDKIKNVIRKHYSGHININTNFSMLDDRFFEDDITLAVSYDFEAREKSDLVFSNMLMSKKPIAVLILASQKVIHMNVDDMIQKLNLLSSVISVEIKPYSINQANQHPVTHKQFEEFVIRWIESPIQKNFEFMNEINIYESLDKTYNAFSDDHIYITPNGNYGVLEFDINDKEYFLELSNYSEYEKWAEKEKVGLSDICKDCKYVGHCLTEHYRYVKNLDHSCNGYKGLLDYYDQKY
jgi:sulfatase maturation enzyme AslB (radical SAM superfamily)